MNTLLTKRWQFTKRWQREVADYCCAMNANNLIHNVASNQKANAGDITARLVQAGD
jgi:hypothetical protein